MRRARGRTLKADRLMRTSCPLGIFGALNIPHSERRDLSAEFHDLRHPHRMLAAGAGRQRARGVDLALQLQRRRDAGDRGNVA